MPKILCIEVSILKQRLFLKDKGKVLYSYPISTSKYGEGNKRGSNKTPLGRHCIVSKLGRNAPLGTIFKRRRNTGKIVKGCGDGGDLITTRILRLEGLERGVNKGKGIDSFQRCIYIHGTPEEKSIGKPASHGCIRMKNKNIIELFDLVDRNTEVRISR